MLRKRRAGDAGGLGQDIFHALRSQALTVVPSSIGVAPTAALPRVFGVVMDMTYSSGTATLAAFADGTASMYTSTGGGVIGGGTHENVASAARELLQVAEGHLGGFSQQELDGLPSVGGVRITVLTYEGRLSVEAPEDDLGRGHHGASSVFHAAHGVITALRLVESGQGSGLAGTAPLSGGATAANPDQLGMTPRRTHRLAYQN